jgi:glycosyltransferase involved in cell wall biosynthesis
MAQKVEPARFQFCVSKHNLKEYRRFGLNPFYVPWGVDTQVFHKKVDARARFNKLYNIPDNTFLIGAVGNNMYSDRKNFVNLLRGFAYFVKEHPNSKLYIHTTTLSFYSLFKDFIRASAGLAPNLGRLISDFGLKDKVIFPNQIKLSHYGFSPDDMADIYNAFDVFCLPTKGESFCLPLLESQACETPVIVTNTTACTEMVQSDNGWLIPVDEDDYVYTDTGSWAAELRPLKIAQYIEKGYDAWNKSKLVGMGGRARESVLDFDWNYVFDKYWIPFIEMLERNK